MDKVWSFPVVAKAKLFFPKSVFFKYQTIFPTQSSFLLLYPDRDTRMKMWDHFCHNISPEFILSHFCHNISPEFIFQQYVMIYLQGSFCHNFLMTYLNNFIPDKFSENVEMIL